MKNPILLFILLLSQQAFAQIESLPHCTKPMVEFKNIEVCTYKLEDNLYVSLVKDLAFVPHFGLDNDAIMNQWFFESPRQLDLFHTTAEEWMINHFETRRVMEGFPRHTVRLMLPPLKSPSKQDESRGGERTK